MTIEPKHRHMIVTIVAGLLTLAYVMLVFLPGQKGINQTNELASTHETYLQSTVNVDLRLAEASNQLVAAQQFNASWRQHAPKVGQLGGTLGQVVEHASAAEVKVVNFDPQSSLDGVTVRRVPVSIQCEGTLAQVFEFIRRLESMPQTSWVDECRIQQVKKENSVGQAQLVRAELSLAIFADNQENSG